MACDVTLHPVNWEIALTTVWFILCLCLWKAWEKEKNSTSGFFFFCCCLFSFNSSSVCNFGAEINQCCRCVLCRVWGYHIIQNICCNQNNTLFVWYLNFLYLVFLVTFGLVTSCNTYCTKQNWGACISGITSRQSSASSRVYNQWWQGENSFR